MIKISPVLRFLVVGGSAALVNWVSRIILSGWMSFEIAVFLAYCIGMVVGYLGYRTFVYEASNSPLRLEVLRFIAVNAVSALVVVGISSFLTRIGLPAIGITQFINEISHATAIALGAVLNYHAHARITFAAYSNKNNTEMATKLSKIP